jgi:hypothetical protein
MSARTELLMEEVSELQGRIAALREAGQDVTLLVMELELKKQNLNEAVGTLNRGKVLKG